MTNRHFIIILVGMFLVAATNGYTSYLMNPKIDDQAVDGLSGVEG